MKSKLLTIMFLIVATVGLSGCATIIQYFAVLGG